MERNTTRGAEKTSAKKTRNNASQAAVKRKRKQSIDLSSNSVAESSIAVASSSSSNATKLSAEKSVPSPPENKVSKRLSLPVHSNLPIKGRRKSLQNLPPPSTRVLRSAVIASVREEEPSTSPAKQSTPKTKSGRRISSDQQPSSSSKSKPVDKSNQPSTSRGKSSTTTPAAKSTKVNTSSTVEQSLPIDNKASPKSPSQPRIKRSRIEVSFRVILL